jgi:hypothetical protein
MILKKYPNILFTKQIAFVKDNARGQEFGVTIKQIVENDNPLGVHTRFEQTMHGMGADVPGAARDQNFMIVSKQHASSFSKLRTKSITLLILKQFRAS